MSEPNPDAVALSLLRAANDDDRDLFDRIMADVCVADVADIVGVLLGWTIGLMRVANVNEDVLWQGLGAGVIGREQARPGLPSGTAGDGRPATPAGRVREIAGLS